MLFTKQSSARIIRLVVLCSSVTIRHGVMCTASNAYHCFAVLLEVGLRVKLRHVRKRQLVQEPILRLQKFTSLHQHYSLDVKLDKVARRSSTTRRRHYFLYFSLHYFLYITFVTKVSQFWNHFSCSSLYSV